MVRGAVSSTANEREAGALSLPAASIASTQRVCGPVRSPGVVYGEVHGTIDPPSIRQAKVESASFETNEKRGLRLLMSSPSLGPLLMPTDGTEVSVVKARKASKAGFGVRSRASRPALPQRRQIAA